jgi:hypothetical protein
MTLVDWPVGTADERAESAGELPGKWVNSNPFHNWYEIAPKVMNWHDGVDLNLNVPVWNSDWHKPLYAPASGLVYFAGVGGGSWGHIICGLSFDPLTGRPFTWRVGHIEKPIVEAGQYVWCGDQIAQVGNGDGYYGQSGAHCHFNLCTTSLMIDKPNQWCGTSESCVLGNYIDPVEFIRTRYGVHNVNTADAVRQYLATLPADSRVYIVPEIPPEREPLGSTQAFELKAGDALWGTQPTPAPEPVPATTKKYATGDGLRVRDAAETGNVRGYLMTGDSLQIGEVVNGWAHIASGQMRLTSGGLATAAGLWISDAYLSVTNPKA